MKKDEQKLILFEWIPMSWAERRRNNYPTTRDDMCHYLQIARSTFVTWYAEYQARKVQDKMDAELRGEISDNGDELQTVIKNLEKMAETKPEAARLWLQMKGLLQDNKGLEIDGNTIIGAILTGERKLREGDYGSVDVQEELSLLPPELCPDTGQDITQDN